MNTTSTITLPIDTRIKREAEEKAEKAGFSFEYFVRFVVDNALRNLVKQKTIGTEIRFRLEEPNKYFIKSIKKARENRKAGKGSPIFDNSKEAIAWLEKQGI